MSSKMEGSPKQFGAVIHDLSEWRRRKNEVATPVSKLRAENIGGVVIDAALVFKRAQRNALANPTERAVPATVIYLDEKARESRPSVEDTGERITRAMGIIVLMQSGGFPEEADLLSEASQIAARQGESGEAIYSLALDHLFSVSRELYDKIVQPSQPDALY